MKTLRSITSTSSKQNHTTSESLPQYCDYSCPHATFAPTEASGACRREAAVFCTLLRKYNNKNAGCIARRQNEIGQ